MKEMFRMVDKSKVDEVKQMLEYTQKGTAKATVGNYMVVLRNDPLVRESMKYNKLTGRIDIVKKLWWNEEIYWSTENKNSLLKFSKEMEQEISEYRKQFTQEDTMAGMIQGWLDAYKGTHVCSVQIWKGAFDHFDREPKKFETNEICSIMDTQITGWKRAGVHRFSKEGYGRQRSWVREGTEEGGNEPDKDGFTKLTKAEQLELPFDLPDKENG